MDLLNLDGYNLRGLDRKNIILGKNGCGKSRMLRFSETALRREADAGSIKYLSPERGGLLQYEAQIDQNLSSDLNWISNERRKNQASQFRQQSAAQFGRLESLILREIEQDPAIRRNEQITFNQTVDRINALLDRVLIKRGDRTFVITDRNGGATVSPSEISSGESELISLGIECLVFEKECKRGKRNVLLIDEPDVHLHPDLQARFAKFIEQIAQAEDILILIATHSTALLGAMSEDEHTRIAFIGNGDTDITFTPVTDSYKKVLPVFGAHPLSNIFNQAPVLLLEGDDDERIWQQAVRSANGRIKIYPCAVDGISQLKGLEEDVSKILQSVYDNAVGFSLRDRDEAPTEINDIGPVKRMRLNCRAAENLLLSDEVLQKLGIGWDDLKSGIQTWLTNNSSHPHYGEMESFAESDFDRANANLKDIRNDLMGLIGNNKPWEVIVGQTISALLTSSSTSATSLASFLGHSICENLLGIAATG
jgi:predicted ATPase